MYKNIGKKLKTLAQICGILGIIVAVASLLPAMFDGFYEETLLIFIGGLTSGLFLFIGSWPLYAFGQIVEDIHKMSEKE